LHDAIQYVGPGLPPVRTLLYPVIVGYPDYTTIAWCYFDVPNRMVRERTLSRRVITRFYNLPVVSGVRGDVKAALQVTSSKRLLGIGRINGDVIDLSTIKTSICPRLESLGK